MQLLKKAECSFECVDSSAAKCAPVSVCGIVQSLVAASAWMTAEAPQPASRQNYCLKWSCVTERNLKQTSDQLQEKIQKKKDGCPPLQVTNARACMHVSDKHYAAPLYLHACVCIFSYSL